MKNSRKYMFVRIPFCVQHEGFQPCVRRIRISAFCPKCGQPRGKVVNEFLNRKCKEIKNA